MTKRPRDKEEEGGDPSVGSSSSSTKRPRHTFRAAPENLPDGPWRRKLAKDKKEQNHQAKLERQYAKIKARSHKEEELAANAKFAAAIQRGTQGHVHHPEQQQQPATTAGEKAAAGGGGEPRLHPDRQAMLDGDAGGNEARPSDESGGRGGAEQQEQGKRLGGSGDRRRKRPDYFRKDLASAERRKQEAAARAEEARRREEERARKTAERERMRKAMEKARRPTRGPNGEVRPRKLGRESGILLEKVKKLVGNGP